MTAIQPLADYDAVYREFDTASAERDILGDAPFNAALLCCDRHVGQNRTALIAVSPDGTSRHLSFETLKDQSERFAQVLRDNGIGVGDVVACLLPRVPELFVTAIALWRLGAVYQPLFTAFGPKAIEHRVTESGAKIIVTDAANRHKLDGFGFAGTVIAIESSVAGDLDFHTEIAAREAGLELVIRARDDPFLIMFTSGTTGPAKPLFVPIHAIASFASYMTNAVGLRPDDSFWNIADPGWAYGLYYAVVGPLALGHTTLMYDGPFTVESTTRIICEQGITNLAGSPTAYRLLIAAGPDALAAIKGQLHAVSSAGEPLNPEVIRWFAQHLDTVIHDHYGQTEMGMSLCNHHALTHPVQPGAAGYSMPGFRMAVIDRDDQELAPGIAGDLAVDLDQSPFFWFTGYHGMATPALGNRFYRTGDTAERNADASISFVGRDDDVITSSGYRIGPFDVESALLEHNAVVEVAVIGKPDPDRTEIVKAFVVLQTGFAPTPALSLDLTTHVKRRLSAHAFPREIEFVDELPKTPSGKIQRFILRNQEIAKAKAAPVATT